MNPLFIPLGGLWALDRHMAFNFMLSRPFVISIIVGLINGNLYYCVLGGIFFEFIGLLDLPVGTHINRDNPFAGFTVAYIISTCNVKSFEEVIFAIILTSFFVIPVTLTDWFVRYINKLIYVKVVDKNVENREGIFILIGLILSFIRGSFVYTSGALLAALLFSKLVGVIHLKHVSVAAFVLVSFLLIGFFSGFLHTPKKLKPVAFIAGGVIAWLIF